MKTPFSAAPRAKSLPGAFSDSQTEQSGGILSDMTSRGFF